MESNFEFKTKAHKPYYSTRVRRKNDEKRTNAGNKKVLSNKLEARPIIRNQTSQNQKSEIVALTSPNGKIFPR